ncbi:hypothetical protein JHK82_030327 [Glycine max]|nr:hypothetical protein JHK87_030224 [Glycine soja]KAG4987975.1 hypothetical protein JHK85_030958 [Glycine max]KAG4993595.1 hypothetical protein JHK86_030422 [Glycine max]KAG5123590.1 hypothetical protein JHK82_030327 [Glycine max]KAG5145013.1 hypothetical protein JHK84_030556 [Glycine max]
MFSKSRYINNNPFSLAHSIIQKTSSTKTNTTLFQKNSINEHLTKILKLPDASFFSITPTTTSNKNNNSIPITQKIYSKCVRLLAS